MTATEVKKGLDGVVVTATRLSKVEREGRLIYCGYDIHDLAQNASFEEIVFLLWNNRLPTKTELDSFRVQLRECTEIPGLIFEHMKHYSPEAHPMAALRTAVSALSMIDPVPDDTTPEHIRYAACQLLGSLPAIVAGWHRVRRGLDPIPVRADLGHAANYLWMLHGKEPDPLAVRAVDMYLVLLADHGLNASTFAARVTTSTQSDMYSAITSAIGALKGVAHGGANEAAMRMFMEIGDASNVENWFRQVRAQGKRIMGIGHRIYKHEDPRAVELVKMSEALAERMGGDVARWHAIAIRLAEIARSDPYFVDRNLYPNVDYYSAPVLYAAGVPVDLFTPTFAISRVAGWSAHILEQWEDNRLIRPQSEYIGLEGLPWPPLDAR